jgi:hypothetical protein
MVPLVAFGILDNGCECLGNCRAFRSVQQGERVRFCMSERSRLMLPGADFDPRPSDELANAVAALAVGAGGPIRPDGRRSPLDGYARVLTPEGGILITYKDQKRHLILAAARVVGWSMATSASAWCIFGVWHWPSLSGLAAVAALTGINWLVARWKIIVSHSIEIRPDMMIIDGEDIFFAEDIGDHWPEVQMLSEDDPDRMVVVGICGTRRIEYATANRRDKNDKTPEVLAADLQAAMEQLWGRREVKFATAASF